MGYATRRLADEARLIFLRTLGSINVPSLIERRIKIEKDLLTIDGIPAVDLSAHDEVVVIGFGKASLPMGAGIEQVLGKRIRAGLLVTDRLHDLPIKSDVIIAGHPIPNMQSMIAGQKALELVRSCGQDALIVFLISGGGSSLIDLPVTDRISLADLQQANLVLTGCGASIEEINTVRKHLSSIKGGKLGWTARNIRCLVLLVSDVNPGDTRSIASNPILPDPASLDEMQRVIQTYDLIPRFPRSIREMLAELRVPELPRFECGERITIVMLMDNSDALATAARQIPFRVEIADDIIEGEYTSVADRLIERLRELAGRFPGERVCLLSGGEVSCRVEGGGFGGRNQQFVLYSALSFSSLDVRGQIAVLSCGTDGIDGNSVAAGAVADQTTIARAESIGIDAGQFFRRSDAFSLFSKVGGAVLTGPTGNNVRDLRVMLAGPLE